MPLRLRLGHLFLFPLGFLASTGRAQVLEVRLRDEADQHPISGAIVRLLDGGRPLAQGLTDEFGRVTLRAPRPGPYRIKADRIGGRGLVTEPHQVLAGQTLRVEIRMPSGRTELPTLAVTGRRSCGAPEQTGEPIFVLWDEVRKALTANVLTHQARVTPLHVREFLREVGLDGEPRRQWVTLSRVVRGAPFGSLPVGDLVTVGFVRDLGDSVSFAAPDAATLLADEFVSTHCFRAVTGSEGLVGLAFEPAPGRRVPDISGILWLDRLTSALRSLDFSYTGLKPPFANRGLGGKVEFVRIPDGRWIIGSWYLRMPRVEARREIGRPDGEVPTLSAYLDRGGRAELATDSTGIFNRSIVRGRVHDSTTGTGLANAFVVVPEARDSVLVGPDGRFELAVAVAGDQAITARHPKLGLLQEPVSRTVLLSIGDTTEVEFAVPSIGTLVQSSCRQRAGRTSLAGIVWNRDGQPAAGREIRIMRPTLRGNMPLSAGAPTTAGARKPSVEGTPTVRQVPGAVASRPVRSDARGFYRVCDLPAVGVVHVLSLDVDGSIRVEFPVTLSRLPGWLDLREWGTIDSTRVGIDLDPEPAAPAGDPKGAQALRPKTVLAGTVRDESSRVPIENAEVLLEGTDRRTETDKDGRYHLSGLPAGPAMVLFRSIGFRAVRLKVTLGEGDTTRADLAMVRQGAQELAPLEVTAATPRPRGIGREAIEDRRRLGFGVFIDSSDLRRYEHRRVSDVLRAVRGLNVVRFRECTDGNRNRCGPVEERAASGRGEITLMRGRGRDEYCWMSVLLDGNTVYQSGSTSPPPDLSRDFRVADMEAIEVYRSSAEVPSEFAGAAGACGIVLLWSRRG